MEIASRALRRARCGCCCSIRFPSPSTSSGFPIARCYSLPLPASDARRCASAVSNAKQGTLFYAETSQHSPTKNQPSLRQKLMNEALAQYKGSPDLLEWHGLQPGDWVESRGHRRFSELLFLGPSEKSSDLGVFLSQSGLPVVAGSHSVVYVLPKFIDHNDAIAMWGPLKDCEPYQTQTRSFDESGTHAELGLLESHDNPLEEGNLYELQLRRRAVREMRRLALALDKIAGLVKPPYDGLSLPGAHALPFKLEVAVRLVLERKTAADGKRRTDWAEMDEIGKEFPGREHNLLELMVQRAILEDPLSFVPADEEIRFTRSFIRRSQPHLKAREYAAMLYADPDKVAALKLNLQNGKGCPSEFKMFLFDYLANYSPLQEDIYTPMVSSILKGIVAPGSSEGDLTPQVLSFLHKYCETPKTENLVLHDSRAPMNDWDDPVAIQTISDDSLFQDDPLEDLRKDVHDPVYVIDAPSAHELDDGISIEHLPDNTFWVHVHVADPAAVLPAKHRFSAQAQWRMQSLYFDQRMYGMLPEKVYRSDVNLGNSSPQRTLLFSTRFDADLKIIEESVRPGRAHKVVRTTYDHVDAVLRGKDPPKIDVQRPLDDLPKETEATMTLLSKVAEKLLADRVAHGMLMIQPPRLQIPHQSPDEQVPNVDFPDEVGPRHPGSLVMNATAVVQETMIMANRLAGRFCAKKGSSLPVPYREIKGPRPGSKEAAQIDTLKEARDSKTGEVSWRDAIVADALHTPATYSIAPGPHLGIGIKDAAEEGGYLQVTSPLRRYTDLLVHWQLHAHFLGQEGPFDVNAVEQLCETFNAALPKRRQLMNRYAAFESISKIQRHVGLEKPAQAAVITRRARWSRDDGCPVLVATLPQLEGVTARVRIFEKDANMAEQMQRYTPGDTISVLLERSVLDMQPTLYAIPA